MHSLYPNGKYEWCIQVFDEQELHYTIETARFVRYGYLDMAQNLLTGQNRCMKDSNFTLYINLRLGYFPDLNFAQDITDLKENYNIDVVTGVINGKKKERRPKIIYLKKLGINKFVINNE